MTMLRIRWFHSSSGIWSLLGLMMSSGTGIFLTAWRQQLQRAGELECNSAYWMMDSSQKNGAATSAMQQTRLNCSRPYQEWLPSLSLMRGRLSLQHLIWLLLEILALMMTWINRVFSLSMQSWGVWYKSHIAHSKCSITRIQVYSDHC